MAIDQNQWASAQALFEEVLAQAPAQRQAFLAQATADEALRDFVKNLIQAHEQSGTVWPESPQEALQRIFQSESAQAWEGREIGNYRLVKRIGEGGMGLVFEALRDDGVFDKKVAVKLVRFDVRSPLNKARFHAERQAMARLEHPYIARLMDGGTEEDVPYLVMEHVEGLPVTTHCDNATWNVRQRLALFRKICEAVQVAHQNLIVHRDIKPSNILVTDAGDPKLLDFGIAKLMDEAAEGGQASSTVTQQRLLTPLYASPEQLLGKPVTTGSDVYSLGVLLFELLSGFRPFSSEKHLTPVEVAATQKEPAAPSRALTKKLRTQDTAAVAKVAAQRASTALNLPKILRGDLDAIVLKALRPEPSQRYETVAQFSEDIRRYLDSEPVEARKKTLTYQFVKFCKRHTAAVSAAVMLIAMAVAFLSFTKLQSIRIAKERDLAQASTRLFMDSFQMADPYRAKGETVTALDILKNAEAKVAREHGDQPELLASLHAAMGQVYLNLNLNERAEPLLDQALEKQVQLYGEGDLRLAGTKQSLARLAFNQGAYVEAESLAIESLQTRREFSDSPREVARSLTLVGNARRVRGDRRGALPFFEEAMDLLAKEGPEAELDLVNTMNALAYTLTLLSEFEKAEPLYLEGLALLEKVMPGAYPLKARMMRRLCTLYLRKKMLPEAETYLMAALEMNRKLYGEEHVRIAVNLHDWGNLKNRLDLPYEAEALYRESLAMKTKLLGDSHPGLNGTLINLAGLLHDRGELLEAEAHLRQALRIHHARFKKPNMNLAFLEQQAGFLLKDLGQWQEAEGFLCRSIDGFMKFSSRPKSRIADSQLVLAEMWLAQDVEFGAKLLLESCLAIFEKRQDQDRIARTQALLANL